MDEQTRTEIEAGSTDSRYVSSWASKTSAQGIDTTRTRMPFPASSSCAFMASATSEPVAMIMACASPPSASRNT